VHASIAGGLFKDYIQSIGFEGDDVRYSTQIRPISYLKANAAEVLQELGEQREPMVITQNGEAKAVLQDVVSFEQTQETLALLKILALGNQQMAQGKSKPVGDVVKRLRARKGSD
jgi:prevent-host-death family protein